MQSPEEFIAELFHIREYDPAARREYYLKTRKLKGRRVGAGKTAIARHPSTVPVKRPVLSTPKKTSDERRKETEARVAALQERLAKLKKVLAELVAQAKARSGVEPTQAPKPVPANATPKQKADAAKASKDYYEKNKDEILSEQAKALETQIKSVEDKIQQMRSQLAIVRARTLKGKPDPVGAGTRIPTRKENSR
jgi:hypothetical protein